MQERNAELDENSMLAAEVEEALKSLRIAGAGEDDGDLRLAVDSLRRASHLLASPAITITGQRHARMAAP